MSEGKSHHHSEHDDDDDPLTFTKVVHTPNGDQITTQRLLPDGSYQWESHGPLGHSTGFSSGYYITEFMSIFEPKISQNRSGGNGFYSSSSSMGGSGGLSGNYQASGMHSSLGGTGQSQSSAQSFGFGPGMGSFQGSQMGSNGMGMMSAQGMFNGMPVIPSMAPITFAPMIFPKMEPMKPMKMWPSLFGKR